MPLPVHTTPSTMGTDAVPVDRGTGSVRIRAGHRLQRRGARDVRPGPLATTLARNRADSHRGVATRQIRAGGGAENRTPVHDNPLGGISRFSRQVISATAPLSAHSRQPSQFGLNLRHTGYVRRCDPHDVVVPALGMDPGLTSLLIKQRGRSFCCQLKLTVPLFNVARRPRPASSLKAIVSKPVAPVRGSPCDLSTCMPSDARGCKTSAHEVEFSIDHPHAVDR